VALVFASLAGGGLERSMLCLAQALIEQGFRVDLVVGHAEGELLADVPPEADVVELGYAPMWPIRIQALKAEPTLFGRILHPKMRSLKSILPMRQLPDLVRYFATVAPDAVLSAEPKYNLLSMWARRVAGLGSRIVLTEHVHALSDEARLNLWAAPHLLPSLRNAYLKADAIVAVSDGLAHHLACQAGIPRDRITTVYNPVVGQDLPRKAREPIDHPWFGAGNAPRTPRSRHSPRAASATSSSSPHDPRRSATRCWILPSGSPPGCSTMTPTATTRSPARSSNAHPWVA
jgi:glycosyltransferase involved in cell wall biosynthesis